MLLSAELISPPSLNEWRERGYLAEGDSIRCDRCNMTYLDTEYDILFKNHKLGYFYFTQEGKTNLYQLCHDCLFKKIKKISDGEIVDLVIVSDAKQYHCKFYPKNLVQEKQDNLHQLNL